MGGKTDRIIAYSLALVGSLLILAGSWPAGGAILTLLAGMALGSRRPGRALRFARRALEHSPELILWFGPDGKICYANEAATRALGYDPRALADLTLRDLDAEFRSEDWTQAFDTLKAWGSHAYITRYRTREGTTFPVEVLAFYMEVDGIRRILTAARNTAEREWAEAQLRRSKDQADAANRAKSVFLANMSHELRTPLHGILSYARFGAKRFDHARPEKLLDYFHRIESSGQTLLHLLDDLLDLAKLEAGKLVPDLRRIDPALVALRTVDELSILAEEKGVRIRCDACRGEGLVMADEKRLAQVMRNLLANAVKFSPAGSAVHLRVAFQEDRMIGSVRDEGPGIPEDELSSIFDKFVQSSKTSSGAGGTGLGLPISREILSVHGGELTAENHEEGGAIFRFTLPRAASDPPHPKGEKKAAALQKSGASAYPE